MKAPTKLMPAMTFAAALGAFTASPTLAAEGSELLETLKLPAGFIAEMSKQAPVVLPSAISGSVHSEQTRDPKEFSLSFADIAAIAQSVPEPGSTVDIKVLKVMSKVFRWSPGTPRASGPESTLRVVSWNAADPRGDAVAATLELMESAGAPAADVYLIQELGLPAARAMANHLNLYLAWAPEFLEVGENASGRDPATGDYLTGNAVFSSFPIIDAYSLRFGAQADWYEDEKAPSVLEKARLAAGKFALGAEVKLREVRPPPPYGGRMALFVNAQVPGLGPISFVNIHLENHGKPKLRRAQMKDVIEMVRRNRKPVIFGGDLNTIGSDGRRLTPGRLIAGQLTRAKLIDRAAGYGANYVPYGGMIKKGFEAFNFIKRKEDPTSVFNPEHHLFNDVRDRLGVEPANERDRIGYKHTWSTERAKQASGRVLDWVFLYDPTGALKVTDARTEERLIEDTGAGDAKRASDHYPVTTQLSY